ncbi:MAG: fused response regulator/phosphatase [Candidatus Promineifilaceae bacterium]|nr:fused response regulator/phosphatase [Candidatus Promineifilaceae bacterium]
MSNVDPGYLLVVDDNELNRDMLSRRLQRQGHTVAVAENGRQALEMLHATPFDLVLLDIMMPVLDGYQTLEAMKAHDTLCHIPVIMVSAVDELKSVVRCIEMGAEDYLPKPFNPVLLRARVDASLEKKRLRDKERLYAQSLERDLEIGREIQSGFFPEQLPAAEGWEIAAYFQAARQVAGDFYDAFELADRRTVALIIADVCDKGVGAALFMALFRTLLRAIAHRDVTPTRRGPLELARLEEAIDGEVRLRHAVSLTNDYIATTHGSSNMFATVFFALLDTASGRLVYINAGHEPPILLRGGGGQPTYLAPTGPAVGMLPNMKFGVETIDLSPGDTFIAFTDGVTEARAEDGAFYGDDRLLQTIHSAPPGAQAALDHLAAGVHAHIGEAKQSDDITMVAVRCV